MQTCPFCNFDAGDRPLNEGRCPQCGSIVQWSDEDIAATIQQFNAQQFNEQQPEQQQSEQQQFVEQQSSAVNITEQSQPTPIAPVAPNRETSDPTRASESYTSNKSSDPNESSDPDEPIRQEADPAEVHGPSPTPTPVLLSRLWKDSLASTGNVRGTLKGEEAEITVSDTIFSIQTREVRPVSDTPSETLDYELLGVIGQGGVGVVYSARQASIDRSVALKMLREEYRHREDHRDKFLAEAVLTGELDHPNIVPIYDLGRSHTGELFYSMKNVVGTPWDRVITTKSLEENLDILLKVADAIAFAHSRGVIHRDLKPENVMLGNYGEVLVMDWGIALPTAEFRKSSSILRSQAMGGTPAYMAPEMAKGPVNTIGNASDIYLLGAVLFEILTGYPPHFGKDVMDCVTNAAKNIIRSTTVTGELMDIAIKSMATLPRRRYRTVQDFQAAIRLYQSHSESISLSDNAERELAEGIESKDYQKFSRSVFAFQESLVLWADNTLAQSGLARAKLAYASTALEKGDYDLGLSLLQPNQPDEKRLIDRLQSAIAERDARQGRLKTMRRVAVGMVAFILIAGFVALSTIWQLYQEAQVSQKAAVAATQKALDEKQTADGLRIDADNERDRAKKQTIETEKARRKTELARLESLADRRRAEESSYIAETGLIAASIAQNNFGIAKNFLLDQANSSSKSNLRHWEWGRFQYLVQGGAKPDKSSAVEIYNVAETVESIDCSADGSLVVVGMGNGLCQLWRAGVEQAIEWNNGRMVSDLDLDASGKLLVTCGLNEDRAGCVRVWQLAEGKAPALLKERTLDRQPSCVAFCNAAGAQQIAIGDMKNVARIWSWQSAAEDVFLLGHNAAVNQVEYAPDDRWVGTASSDGTVRLFDSRSGKEVQRFSGHQGAVWCLTFSPDNRAVASGGDDQRILLWPIDASEGTARQMERMRLEVAGKATSDTSYVTLQAHSGTVRDLSFSPTGSQLASAGTDNLVCVWELTEFAGSSGTATAVSAVAGLLQKATRDIGKPIDVPVQRLRGHGGWVHSCVISQDGKRVISGADDHSWRIWHADRYLELITLGDGKLPIADAQFTTDGNLVVLAMSDGTIQLWDRRGNKMLDKLVQGHDYLTNRAQLLADGRRLVTAAGDNTLRLWDVARGNQLRVMEHSGRNAVFHVTPDTRWLIASGDEKGVAIWDLSTNDDPVRFRSAAARPVSTTVASKTFSEPTCVAISDDGRYFIVGESNGRCEFWDRSTGTKLHSINGHAESVVAAFAIPSESNNATFITAAADGTVAWWNAADGQEVSGERLKHRSPVQVATLSSDRRYLATSSMLGNGKGRIWLWDLNTRQSLATHDTSDKSIQDVSFRKFTSPDEMELIITTADLKSSGKELWSWSPMRKVYQPIERQGWLSSSTWGTSTGSDPNSILIYGGRGARLWNWQSDRPVMQYRSSSSVTAVALSPDGQHLASGGEDGSIVLWDLQQRQPRETFANVHEARINDLAFSQDSSQLASVGADGLLVLRSLSSGESQMRRLADKSLWLNSVTFSPDGSMLAITADDELVRVHDTATLKQLHKFPGHAGRVYCARFSPDQQSLASGGEDKIIRIWSLAEDRQISELIGHSADVTSLDFSGDGLRLLSGSRDTSSKIWDVSRSMPADPSRAANSSSDLRELLTLEQHSSDIVLVQFSPDGSEILTAGKEGRAILWPACKVNLALRLSAPSIDYAVGTGPVVLDRQATLSETDVRDCRNAVLRIRLIPDNTETEPVELPKDFKESIGLDTRDGYFQQEGSQIIVKASGQKVAELRPLANSDLEIKLDGSITHQLAQQLIRHLQYEASTEKLEDAVKQTRIFQFELFDASGESGNATAEELIINLVDPRDGTSKRVASRR